jgi:acetylornithine deacetylase/succinyl-diaminopimelate desuccinylase-like protein
MPDTSYAGAVAAAEATVVRDRLADICEAMVNIASPTGGERPLAEYLAAEMSSVGLHGQVQPVAAADPAVDASAMANAHGRIAGSRSEGVAGVDGGADQVEGAQSLLLYAPIDTVTVGNPHDDLPWAGPEMRPDFEPNAERRDDLIVGLGAQNPKGHGACVLAAAEALVAAEVPLRHDLLVGFGAGGMPSNRRAAHLPDGHGEGCRQLVQLLRPSRAIIAKTGWAISWEEVGLTWFEVEVSGSHTYVGSRHLLPYRNAIADAGYIVAGLEHWFERWAEEHRSGLVAPQGVVSAIEGGWPHMPAFTTAQCTFHVDLRLSPRTLPEQANAAFRAEVARLAAEIGATATVRPTVAIPGTTTAPDDPVIAGTIAAWEQLTDREHQPIAGLSGATDANILRAEGVPTARVGLPKVSPEKLAVDFQLGMNAVDLADMELLTKLLIRSAVSMCGVD